MYKDRVEVVSPSKEEGSSLDQPGINVAEHINMVKTNYCLDLVLSRGCPIRNLALQQV
jgi:hypothetical protein